MKRYSSAHGESGFAIVTALWLVIIGVMLVTTMSSMLIGQLGAGSASLMDVRSRIAAFSGVQRALAELMADRPTGSGSADTRGIEITEICNKPDFGPTVSINGFFVHSGSDEQISIYNWGLAPINITGFYVDAPAGYTDITIGAVTLAPGEARWFTSNLIAAAGSATPVYLRKSAGGDIIDQVTINGTAAGQKWVCLPDGANVGGANGSAGVDTKAGSPTYGQTYRWVLTPFQHIAGGVPGTNTETSGSGIWLDGYRVERCTSAGVLSYTIPAGAAFLPNDSTVILTRDTAAGQWARGYKLGAVVISVGNVVLFDSTTTGSDSVSIRLRSPSNALVSSGDALNFKASGSSSYSRTSNTGAMGAAASTPGTVGGAWTAEMTPRISEIMDTMRFAETVVISQVCYEASVANSEFIELYNPLSTPVSLSGMRLYNWNGGTGYHTFGAVSIAARSYYLIGHPTGYVPGDFGGIPVDASYSWANALSNASGVRLQWGAGAGGTVIDAVGWSGVNVGEGAIISAGIGTNRSIRRKAYDGSGSMRDFGDNATDFYNWAVGIVPRNAAFGPAAATPPEDCAWSNVSPDEFIEIYLPPKPAITASQRQRRFEYIEIQNNAGGPVDLVASDFWIAVDTPAPSPIPVGNTLRRRIYPLFGGSNSLNDGEVGIIIAIDGDTSWIASRPGALAPDPNDPRYHWFGLGPMASSAQDTMLALASSRDLRDSGDVVIVGSSNNAGAPITPPYWFGVPLPVTGVINTGSDTTWRKVSLATVDDTTVPHATFMNTNWTLNSATPGIGLSSGGAGRIGYDGAGDTWYRYNYDDYVFLYSTGGVDLYHRTRIFDEGGKINVNAVSSTNDAIESGLFPRLLEATPNPPFSVTGTFFSAANANGLYSDLRNTWQTNKLLTPLSVYNIYNAANTAGWRNIDSYIVPFLTIYGYNEQKAITVNVNTAESNVLQAAFVQMMAASTTESGYPTRTLAQAQVRARDAANRVYLYLTNHDGGLDSGVADDTGFLTVSAAITKIGALMPTAEDTTAWNNSTARINKILAVASSNYFTIYTTSFVFRKGANVNTDTPISTARIVAVARRHTSQDKAEILYWREKFDLNPASMAFTFPIGTTRYPKRRWDPNQ